MSPQISQRSRVVLIFLAMVVLVATAALELSAGRSDAAVSSHAAVSTTMHGFVHENNDIGLTFDDGSSVGSQARDVPTIPAGTYTVRVADDADIHNFHLVGPGVDQATSVDNTGSPTWTVTFQAGATYRYVCDTHSDFMYGVFAATGAGGASGGSSGGSGGSSGSSGGSSGSSGGSSGSSGGSSGGSSSSGSSTALRGTLAGTVSAAGGLKLALQGKTVSKLKSGRYRVTVVDKSPARSFLVQQSKHGAVTVSGVAFVGTHSVIVNFKAGQWTYFTSAGKASKTSFAVVA